MGPRDSESQDGPRGDLEARFNPQSLKTSGSNLNGRNIPAMSLFHGITVPRAANSQGRPIAGSVGRGLGDFDLDK
jgi:hypothetical protein